MNSSILNKAKALSSKLFEGKKLQFIIVCLIVAILVITVVLGLSEDKSKTTSVEDEVENYVSQLENKLSETLSKVEGVGEVSVIITVESGMETVLAMKTVTTKTSSGDVIEETPVIVNGKTVVLREDYPEIIGVMIVAKGANKISVLNKIQQATVSLLDIELNQIEILTME